MLDRLARLKVPTAAVVHGVCLGGGLELALACRFRVALASNVPLQLGCPEVQLGLIPAWGAIVRLPRLLAPRDALNLLLTGNPIGFLQAKSQGLVDRLVSQDEQDRIAETLEPRAAARRVPCDRATWHDELEFAAAKAEEQPADFPEAQQVIMQLIETDLTQGPEAARRCRHRAVRRAGVPSRHAARHRRFLPASPAASPETDRGSTIAQLARSMIQAPGNCASITSRARLNHGPQRSRIALSAVATTSSGGLEHRVGVVHQLDGPVPACVLRRFPEDASDPPAVGDRPVEQPAYLAHAPVARAVSPMSSRAGMVSATLRYVP